MNKLNVPKSSDVLTDVNIPARTNPLIDVFHLTKITFNFFWWNLHDRVTFPKVLREAAIPPSIINSKTGEIAPLFKAVQKLASVTEKSTEMALTVCVKLKTSSSGFWRDEELSSWMSYGCRLMAFSVQLQEDERRKEIKKSNVYLHQVKESIRFTKRNGIGSPYLLDFQFIILIGYDNQRICWITVKCLEDDYNCMRNTQFIGTTVSTCRRMSFYGISCAIVGRRKTIRIQEVK